MNERAASSGRRLSEEDAALVKGMVERKDRHHDIAAWFGVNQGRIAEVISGKKFKNVKAASHNSLPPKGPYTSGRAAHLSISALESSKIALAKAREDIEIALKEIQNLY